MGIDKAIAQFDKARSALKAFGDLEAQNARLKAEVAEASKTLAAMAKQIADYQVVARPSAPDNARMARTSFGGLNMQAE